MAGISSNALKGVNYPQNRKKYNGIEFTKDLDLDIYDAQFRNLDPQIGRWNQIDPKIENMEMWSPYASNYDNPIRYNDFLGDEPYGGPGLLDKIADGLSTLGQRTVAVALGAGNAFATNHVLGVGRKDVENSGFVGGNALAYQVGQKIGDAASVVTGAVETIAGGGGELVTAGAASPVAIPLTLEGISTTVMGLKNLFTNPIRNIEGEKTHQTYTKQGENGEVYSGKTSGTGTPEQNVANRDRNHHMNGQGYGPAVVDKSSKSSDAIRGREQQLIDKNGGAKSQGGTSGNQINSISPNNPKRDKYLDAAKREFGN